MKHRHRHEGRGRRERSRNQTREPERRELYPGDYGFEDTRQRYPGEPYGSGAGGSRYREEEYDAPASDFPGYSERGYGQRGFRGGGWGYSASPPGFDDIHHRRIGISRTPHYFGTGEYASGGAGFGGGYGDRYEPPRRDYGEEFTPWYGPRAPVQSPPGRRFPPGPKGYQRSDERLGEDICERLLQASGEIDSSDVTVTVQQGKVLLEGTVPARYMKHAIEDLVDACPGVQDIENRIRVQTPGEGAAGAAPGSPPPQTGG